MLVQKFFHESLFLSDPQLLNQLSEISKVEYVPKQKLLAETGEIQLQLAFVLTGVIRGFFLDEDGQDITDCFAYRFGDVVMGCNGIGAPSQINMETLTDCELLIFPVPAVLSLLEQSQDLLNVYNKMVIDGMQRQWREKLLLLKGSAMERYLCFLRDYPGLIDVVNNKYIASFLGMTPVTLSRLRRQLREADQKRNTKV